MSRGVLLAGHGSHLHAESSAPVRAHARSLQARLGPGVEVRAGFWKEEPSLSRALEAFSPGATDITVVPVFIASGYFTRQVIPREMRLQGRLTPVDGRLVRYTSPIGAHPSLARVVLQRAVEAGASGNEALAVLGHGTPRDPDSPANTLLQAATVRAIGAFPEVAAVFLDQEPHMSAVFGMVASRDVVMAPLFIADGWHVGQTIPADMALDGVSTVRDGRTLRFARAVGTHPAVVDVLVELIEEAATW